MHKKENELCIQYIIIVREVGISGTIAARGLKFWLQVALSAPIATAWAEIRKSGSGSGKSGFFETPDFSFFRLFKLKDPAIWVSMDSPGPT